MASAISNQPTGTYENMADRQVRALQLRIAGLSYRAIAREMDISVATAHGDVMDALAELAEQQQANAEQLRALELERLDTLALAASRILRVATNTMQLAAIDRLIRISESRRKLLGLDLQSPLIVEQPYVLTEPERIARLIELLDAARARASGQPLIDVTPEPGDVAE